MPRVGDIFPTVVMPSSVTATQDALRADFIEIRDALQKCADAGTFKTTDTGWLAWQSMKSRVQAYLAEAPSWITTKDQYDRGQLLRKELSGWHDRAKGMGCDAGPAPLLPSDSSTLFGGVSLGMLAIVALFMMMRGK